MTAGAGGPTGPRWVTQKLGRRLLCHPKRLMSKKKKKCCRPGAFYLISGSVLMLGKRREERQTEEGGAEGCRETEGERP